MIIVTPLGHHSTDLPFYARSARATFSCSQSYLAICLGYFGFWPSLICILHYLSGYWAGCLSTRMSTSGYCVFLGDNLLSWSAKQQHTLSRSSAEAEYRGVANVVAETAWLRNLPRELHSPLSTVTLVYCDNVSVVYMSANVVQHQRTKHIEIDIHFVHDMVTAGQVSVLHIPSRYQYADIFTIRLPIALFEEFRSSLIQQICLYMHDLREPHLAALKRILRYVQGTLDFGLHLYARMVGYSDADWVGCPSTRMSTSGWLYAEAEYQGVANVVAETAWLCNLLHELHSPLSTATLVYCDSISAVYMSTNLVQHQRTKHIGIDIHSVRDMVTASQVRVLHVPYRYQYADIFTKGLPSALFE
ncbi:ribonuclease H-like domain-containing protein [Tanacetum coccineum]